jgi:hypothetical protein
MSADDNMPKIDKIHFITLSSVERSVECPKKAKILFAVLAVVFSHVFGSCTNQFKDFRNIAGEHGLQNIAKRE